MQVLIGCLLAFNILSLSLSHFFSLFFSLFLPFFFSYYGQILVSYLIPSALQSHHTQDIPNLPL